MDRSIHFTRIWLLISLLFFSLSGFSQEDCEDVRGKKVDKLLDQADNRKKYELRDRINFLRDAIELEENCLTCHHRLALIFYRRAKSNPTISFKSAEEHFKTIDRVCPEYHSDIPYHLGMIALGREEYKGSLNYFNYFLKFPDDDPTKLSKKYEEQFEEIRSGLKTIEFYGELFENEVPFDPRVVKGVSSQFDEYLPMISPDNELMFYTRKKSVKALGDRVTKVVEEFSFSSRPAYDEIFSSGDALAPPFNLGDNYGGATMSIDNKEMFITVCKPKRLKDGRLFNNCDIMSTRFEKAYSEDIGKEVLMWSDLENLGPNINGDKSWESQPSLSGDGNTLYFATHREGTKTNVEGEPTIDIYHSTRNVDGSWSMAKPILGKINTSANDKAPFMHGDSKTLYFSSDGHQGVGKYDLYFSKLQDDGSWSDPKNLGVPINTEEDEHGMIVSTDGNLAYYASKRQGGKGGLDIYSFELPEAIRPEKVVLLKGEAKDEQGEVISDAIIELNYTESGDVELVEIDQEDGSYFKMINVEKEDVVMTIEKENKAFQARVFTKETAEDRPVAKVEAPLEDVEVGKPYRIDDIYYETASAEIDRGSKLILSAFAKYLQKNRSLKIAIYGHTDDVGQRSDNMELSEERSNGVLQYLRILGVPTSRIIAQGFGPDKPIADNDTEKGKAKNRRTEFVVTGL